MTMHEEVKGNGHAKASKNGPAKKTRINVLASGKTDNPKEIQLPEFDRQVIPVHVQGLPHSTLIVNNFTKKERDRIGGGLPGVVSEDHGGRSARDPDGEAKARRILDAKGRDCIPGRWIKAAIVTATKFTNRKISAGIVLGTVYVVEDLVPIVGTPWRCRHESPGIPGDVVRVQRSGSPIKNPDVRYRPEYEKWSLSFHVEYEPKLISLGSLVYLIRRAGANVGLCEWRPEKRGTHGRFDLVTA